MERFVALPNDWFASLMGDAQIRSWFRQKQLTIHREVKISNKKHKSTDIDKQPVNKAIGESRVIKGTLTKKTGNNNKTKMIAPLPCPLFRFLAYST